MTRVEEIKKILQRKPSKKNWNQLWDKFLTCNPTESAEAMEAVKKKFAKKWGPDECTIEDLDWSLPFHPMLAVVHTITMSVKGMSAIPKELGAFLAKTAVVNLELKNCEHLTDIKELGQIKKLRSLKIIWCRRLADLSGLETLKSLGMIELSGSYSLSDFSPLYGLKKLYTVDLSETKGFSDFQSLGKVKSIRKLILANCTGLSSIAGLDGLQSLTEADFTWCDGIRGSREFANLPKLKRILFCHNNWFEVAPESNILSSRKQVEAYQQKVQAFYANK